MSLPYCLAFNDAAWRKSIMHPTTTGFYQR